MCLISTTKFIYRYIEKQQVDLFLPETNCTVLTPLSFMKRTRAQEFTDQIAHKTALNNGPVALKRIKSIQAREPVSGIILNCILYTIHIANCSIKA